MSKSTIRLPESLTIEGEAAFYRELTPEQRAELLVAACRGAAILLRAHADPERAASYVDPLPASSARALERLRAEARSRGSRRAGSE